MNTIEGIRDYTQYTTLNKVENNFPKTQFVRIHQSYLVNLKYIKYIKNYKAILKNGLELSIPKSSIKMFVIHSYYLKGAYKDVFVLEESNNNLFRN